MLTDFGIDNPETFSIGDVPLHRYPENAN